MTHPAPLTPPAVRDGHDDPDNAALLAMTDEQLIGGIRWRLDAIAANYARAHAVPVQAAEVRS